MIFRRRDPDDAAADVPDPSEGVLDRLRGGARTVIGRQTRFRGTLTGRGQVLVCGTLRGGIHLAGPLLVAPGGTVGSSVYAHLPLTAPWLRELADVAVVSSR